MYRNIIKIITNHLNYYMVKLIICLGNVGIFREMGWDGG